MQIVEACRRDSRGRRTELGQPGLFSARREIVHAGGGAWIIPRPVLRRQASAQVDPVIAPVRGKRIARPCAVDQGWLRGQGFDAAVAIRAFRH